MWTMLNQLPGPDQHNSDLHEQLAHHREIMRYPMVGVTINPIFLSH